MKIAALICLIGLSLPSSITAETIIKSNDLTISVGVVDPIGNFRKFSDMGATAQIRYVLHNKTVDIAALWVDLNGYFFSEQSDQITVYAAPFLFEDAEYRISEYAGATQVGRRSFFRPKAGAGLGLYLFNTKHLIYWIGYEDEPLLDDDDLELRAGWRGFLGVDLFFTSAFGISFEYNYDQVWNLHHTLEFDPDLGTTVKVGRSARFDNFMIGVTIPIE